ncbi:NAD(P)/FAD-dependent oxidoreductase [Pukyongiella litopenaei]|uniref:FAD-binding oxidoreductase n=1 Tax=Pukyongiella litopenaei TaxID=2605946 RepID=A0A2S0MRN6_9RHOB|nr:FAD-binding oxidoreductase [Pukyongiella litopenaei]AVO38559.1 FAD-binding oxidoreductase [Pukyongiella litopenaei]
MRRIFPDYAYGPGPRGNCWWDDTAPAPDWPTQAESDRVDATIIGAGFTGLSAALALAEAGATVAVLEAGPPGWGASGRNGGFCCLGGSRISERALARRAGRASAAAYWQAEHDAVDRVARVLARYDIDADTHSQGETILAHRPRHMARLRRQARTLAAEGQPAQVTEREDLVAQGMGGPFHGALTLPVGFALNPRKYLFGLARAATAAGARLYQDSPATSLLRDGAGWRVTTPRGSMAADQVLVATNGYSSEDLPDWLSGRYLPAQSAVMVTRPLRDTERAAQGWTSGQMAYDTRNLLHYFRLMPDGRFLFGMRGGLLSSPRADAGNRQRLRRHFDAMFPAWRNVEATHMWAGFVCMTAARTPFAGPVPDRPGLFAALGFHGNGVAMGSHAGALVAEEMATGRAAPDCPDVIRRPPGRFPLGRFRRLLMPPLYAGLASTDL